VSLTKPWIATIAPHAKTVCIRSAAWKARAARKRRPPTQLPQVRDRVVGDDPPVGEDQHALAQPLRHFQVVDAATSIS